MGVLYKIKRKLFNRKWRKQNKHNNTSARDIFDASCVQVGNNTYGEVGVLVFNDTNKLHIGNYCSIGPGVQFLLSAEHDFNHLSTFPFKAYIVSGEKEGIGKGDILIDDDVWLGYGATILSGVHIGQGAVVAAGAVVSKDVPPYAIVGGVPAKVIRYRFEKSSIDFLLTLDYGALTENLVREHVDDLYTNIEGVPIEKIRQLYSWFPKK